MQKETYFPEPDIVHRPHLEEKASATAKALPADIANLRLTLDEVYIKKNKDFLKAEIVVATVVCDDQSAKPVTLNLQKFEDIPDNCRLEFGPSGVAMYRNPSEGVLPRFIDYRILVFESDEDTRNIGQLLGDIQSDESYTSIIGKVVTVATAAQPTVGLAIEAANVIVSVIARVLKMNKDDQLIYIAGSYDNAFDNLGTIYGSVVHENDNARVVYEAEAV